MSLQEGILGGASTLADIQNQRRRQELREEREQRLAEEQQNRQGLRVAQNRRAESQEQRAQEQFELDKQKTNAQLGRIEAATNRLEQQNKLFRKTVDDQVREAGANADQAEADVRRTRALADFREKKNEILRFEEKGKRAATALDATQGDFSDFASSPADLFEATSIMSTVASDEIDVLSGESSGFIPVDQDDLSKGFNVVEGRGAEGFEVAKDENGEPITITPEQARNTFQALRSSLRQASLGSPDGGFATTRALEQLSGAGRGSGPPQEQVEQARSQIDQGLEQTGTVRENREQIGNLNSEIRTLNNVGQDLIRGVQPEDQSGSQPQTSNGTRPGGRSAAVAPDDPNPVSFTELFSNDLENTGGRSAAVNREEDSESDADLNNLSEDEVNARIRSLDGGKEVFAREVIERGSEAVAERDTLSGKTLPKAKRLEKKRAQLREIERASPERLQQTQEIMRAANTLARGNGKNLTLEQAFNIMNTGSPNVSIADASEDEVDQHEEFQSRAEEVWDSVDRTNIEDDGRNDAAQKKNFSSRGFSQTMALFAQQPEVAQALKDTGQLRQLAADATEIADERGVNTPNVFLAAETFDSNVDTKRAASVFEKVASQQIVGSEEIGKPEQGRIMRRIVQALENNQGKTDEQVAGEVFSQMQNDNQANQPGSSNTIF